MAIGWLMSCATMFKTIGENKLVSYLSLAVAICCVISMAMVAVATSEYETAGSDDKVQCITNNPQPIIINQVVNSDTIQRDTIFLIK